MNHNLNQYDDLIKKAATEHLPSKLDWRWLKAQLMAESGLNPAAKSPVGALGIAQFMPDTWQQIAGDLFPDFPHATSAPHAIQAAAYYMNQLRNQWTAPRPEIDRHFLALASYNAGLGNILKAQKAADNASDYKTIIGALHHVTGANNAKETRNYVRRIYAYFGGYVLGV